MRSTDDAVTIRRLEGSLADRELLRELAERDSRPPFDGSALVAEVEGRALAAISLTTREVLADPFSRTDELRLLLELRAAQLRRLEPRRRQRRRARDRARATLAGSPPGAGGRLLRLP
jgi:hypothetical protein